MSSIVLWLPAIAVVLHIGEEFVWPGGFAEWYRHYPPGATVVVKPQFLAVMNAILVAVALLPPMLGPTARGLKYWMVVAAIAGANAVFHIVATVRTRGYSPGVVTGVLVYLPLAFAGGAWLLRDRLLAPGTVLEAALIGIVYHVWSGWNHRHHAVR